MEPQSPETHPKISKRVCLLNKEYDYFSQQDKEQRTTHLGLPASPFTLVTDNALPQLPFLATVLDTIQLRRGLCIAPFSPEDAYQIDNRDRLEVERMQKLAENREFLEGMINAEKVPYRLWITTDPVALYQNNLIVPHEGLWRFKDEAIVQVLSELRCRLDFPNGTYVSKASPLLGEDKSGYSFSSFVPYATGELPGIAAQEDGAAIIKNDFLLGVPQNIQELPLKMRFYRERVVWL